MAFGGRTSEMFQCLIRRNNSTRSRVRIGKRAGRLQACQQRFEAGSEVTGRLVELDGGSLQRDLSPDRIADLDAIVEVAIGIECLQQYQLIHHYLLRRRARPFGNAQGCQHLSADR